MHAHTCTHTRTHSSIAPPTGERWAFEGPPSLTTNNTGEGEVSSDEDDEVGEPDENIYDEPEEDDNPYE